MFDYCECECGQRFRVEDNDGQPDESASQLQAYSHYVACPVAFEQAPQLIVEMARTLRDKGLELPKAEGTS